MSNRNEKCLYDSYNKKFHFVLQKKEEIFCVITHKKATSGL